MIILVLANLIGNGIAQDISAAICTTPSDYDGSHEYEYNNGDKRTCATLAAVNGLSSTTKQCTDVKPDGKTRTFKVATNQMATIYGCCGSTGKSACWEDISAAVCATPSDYDANHEYETSNGHKSKCSVIAASIGLTATKQCTGNLKIMTDYFATTYGCCGSSGKSACWEDVSAAAVCLTPSDYDGSHEFDVSGQKMTCDTLAASAGISATNQCASMEQSINALATTYGCCGSSKKSACWVDVSAAICATPGDYDGSHEYDDGSGGKLTCDQVAASSGLSSTTKQCIGAIPDAAIAQAGCSLDETKTMTDCVTKESEAMGTGSDICKSYQALYACYLPCYCDNVNYKSTIDASIDAMKKAVPDCAIKCGDGSALAPRMAKVYTNNMATEYGCCGSSNKSACWEDDGSADGSADINTNTTAALNAANTLQSVSLSVVATLVGLIALM